MSLPIELPITEKGITFANVLKRVAEIPNTAWNNVRREVEAQQPHDVPVTLSIGPTTNTTKQQITDLIEAESQLFNGFSLPRELIAIAYNGRDVRWAEGAWTTAAVAKGLGIDPSAYLPQLRSGCNLGVECWGGMTLTIPGSDVGIIFFGVGLLPLILRLAFRGTADLLHVFRRRGRRLVLARHVAEFGAFLRLSLLRLLLGGVLLVG